MAGDEFTPHSGHSRRIFALRFHPTELNLFLTGGWDNSVKVSHLPPPPPPRAFWVSPAESGQAMCEHTIQWFSLVLCARCGTSACLRGPKVCSVAPTSVALELISR